MKLFDIFKKHTEDNANVAENGMELFTGEVFEIDTDEQMPELIV